MQAESNHAKAVVKIKMFRDRKDAGEQLGHALSRFKNDSNVIVLAIPRGGVEVGYEVAKILNAEFTLIVSRKLGFPNNKETGFGAIAEDGSYVILDDYGLPKSQIRRIMEEQIQEARRRVKALRQGRQFPDIRSKTVILVDDGLAMGVTMQAAIKMLRKKMPKKIIVAVPVSGSDTAEVIRGLADELVVIETPEMFYAVAQAYANWHDVSDEEVLRILGRVNR